jgi:hypothetical protein
MATFPTGIFSTTNPTPTTSRASGTTGPAEQVSALNGEVTAIETFLGVEGAGALLPLTGGTMTGPITTLYLNMSAGAQIIAAGALGLYASADTTTIKMARGTFQNRSFTTAGRPAATGIAGACYWDTTLNALGVSDGTTWHIIPGYIATGTAVLVAGTKAVVNAAITAASKIKVYVLTPGGTVGAPFVSVVAAGTGFTISSTSSSDTSTIQYEIESY